MLYFGSCSPSLATPLDSEITPMHTPPGFDEDGLKQLLGTLQLDSVPAGTRRGGGRGGFGQLAEE